MSNTTIRIRRSATVATPTTLANGELAYSGNTLSDSLFVGVPGQSNAVTRIGGKKYGFLHNAATGNATHAAVEGGTLTANAVIITNANGFVNELRTNKLILGDDGATANITAINAVSNATHLGAATNTEIATTYAIKKYVDDKITQTGAASDLNGLADVELVTPANNQILVYDAGTSQWKNHSIGGTANQVSVTFSGQDITVGLTSNISISGTFTAGSLVGNGASITSVNAATVGGNTVSDILTEAQGYADQAYSNAIAYSGTADTAYANAVAYANAAAGDAYANAVTYANTAAGNAYTNATAFAANADNITSGTLNTARLPATANISTAINVGSGVNLNTSSISVGNSTVNTSITGTGVDIDGTLTAGNTTLGTLGAGATTLDSISVATGAFVVNSTAVYIADDVELTGHILPTANVTYDLGSSDLRFRDIYLSGNTLYLGATLLQDNAGALQTNNIVVLGELTVNGGIELAGNVSFTGTVNTNIIPTTNNAFALGNNTVVFSEVHAANVHGHDGYFSGQVQITGDLIVTGNVTTVNVSSMEVADPLIHLGSNNTSDLLDLGFIGHYSNGSANLHAGVIRHADTDAFYIFKGYADEGFTNTIDIANNTFQLADVYAYLNSGGLISNTTAVTLTANSTVAVNITANGLTLATALAVGSGGTGRNTLTNNAILVGNGTTQVDLVSSSTEGHVLQINADGAPTFGALDGGTF